jgi:uncharacterized protein (DUF1015 family)
MARMATIRPFHGLRYASSAGRLPTLVAPPYDVISETERAEFAAKNPLNVVQLTLPEGDADDRSKFVKYARSAALLAEWRRNGSLALEPEPAYYRYRQTFAVPGSAETLTRTQIVTLLKVEPYENGVVLPHEQTFPKHKEDRLRILEATRSHLECIYGLFEDPGRTIHDLIVGARSSEGMEFSTEDGVRQSFEVLTDPAATRSITEAMGDRKVWIADGHHRYETAVHFRSLHGEQPDLIAEDFMMMALSSMSDPGLVILPTHRVVKSMPVREGQLDTLLQSKFSVRKTPNSALLSELNSAQGTPVHAFGIALPSGMGLFCTAPTDAHPASWIEGPGSERLKSLDVTILHKVIFEQILGLSGLDFFSYTRDPDEALSAVKQGVDAAFLMNPPSVEDMRVIALGSEKMPQKSTYYYPKLLSGLVLWSLSDF